MVAGMVLRAGLIACRFESGNQSVFQCVGGALAAAGKSVDGQRRSAAVTDALRSRQLQANARGEPVFPSPVCNGGFTPFRFDSSEAWDLAGGRTDVLRRGAIAGGLLCAAPGTSPDRAARVRIPFPDKPNVILITLDTVRADHLSLYGYQRDTTPNLRRLARQATVYTHAISPGDMTLSSHASMFTGLYPSWHKAHFDPGYYLGRPLDTRYPTLAEILSSKGFDTAGVVANYLYLAPGFGLDRGFAYHDSSAPVVFLGSARPFLLRNESATF